MQVDKADSSPAEAVCTYRPRVARLPGGVQVPSWLSADTVDRLIRSMDVQVIALSERVLGPGCAIDLEERATPSFHYLREGGGRLYAPADMPAEIATQTLIVVPPGCAFRFETRSPQDRQGPDRTETGALLLCGIFRSLFGNSVDLFDTLRLPIVERFAGDDTLEGQLQLALDELRSGKVCSDVLVSTAIKQVIVALIRRSCK